MHKSKRKTKSVKLPKPIKVKKEKTEEDRTLHSMAHYVDDRLELVKQIFGTLKPKTILNLAPDFLKKKNMEEIEEMCLNELLCISTKRLLSIINATKCPSDTETSSDSDVEHQEEHVSLEEISSDSEIERTTSKAAKHKPNGTGKNSKRNLKNDQEDKTNEDGQISVLELLELQARARAIRSQLALEPITKIEVDSDDGKHAEKDKTTKNIECKRAATEGDNNNKPNSVEPKRKKPNETANGSGLTVNIPEARHSKKIKLKRNYRRSSFRERENDDTDKSKNDTISSNVSLEENAGSKSPDVIPIEAEPETLLISDSETENQIESAEIVMDKVDHQNENSKDAESTETEEGEITDTENEEKNIEEEKLTDNSTTAHKTAEKCEQNTYKEMPEVVSEKNDAKQSSPAINEKESSDKIENKTATEVEEDDDRNDDVISIGGDDLESEMIEHLENETDLKSSNQIEEKEAERDNDIISLESSEDEKTKDESWHSRYLKSSKVSKVLAASRLSKKVRDKIKKSKHQKDTKHEEIDEAKRNVFTSKHEDGSIEQYNELLELRERKNH